MPPTFTAPLYPQNHGPGPWLTGITPTLRWFCDLRPSPRSIPTALALDEPISVITKDIFDTLEVTVNFDVPSWAGRQAYIPSWRGMPCRIGLARFNMVNPNVAAAHGGYSAQEFNVLVRVPDQDPIAPPPTILLGNEFFHHYRMHLHVRFGVLYPVAWPPPCNVSIGDLVYP